MEDIKEIKTKEIKKGRPSEHNIVWKDNIRNYVKSYYYLKGRELLHCDCCNRDIIRSNFSKHKKTQYHIKKDLEYNSNLNSEIKI
jgi:hypothetical protein